MVQQSHLLCDFWVYLLTINVAFGETFSSSQPMEYWSSHGLVVRLLDYFEADFTVLDDEKCLSRCVEVVLLFGGLFFSFAKRVFIFLYVFYVVLFILKGLLGICFFSRFWKANPSWCSSRFLGNSGCFMFVVCSKFFFLISGSTESTE